jgi:hypothetical protein
MLWHAWMRHISYANDKPRWALNTCYFNPLQMFLV